MPPAVKAMNAISVAMMYGTCALPSWPVTKNVPSTIRARAAPGRVTRVRRRRPTRSMMASPISWVIRYVAPRATDTRSAAVSENPLSVRIVGE
jgi:hypothetical protein